MLLGFLTILIMLITSYALMREGLLTAFTMCCNVLLAGLVAFNFWEPLADLIDPGFAGSAMHGYEDALCLFLLFFATLLLLRWATNQLANRVLELHMALQHGGGVFFGLATGYLLAGFLLCVLQTLPWHQKFMNFDPEYKASDPNAMVRRFLPPDRAWLALMHQLSTGRLQWGEDRPNRPSTFDLDGNFELRYARYRRYPDEKAEPRKYEGEFPEQR
jgi:uncharacterized membrane protein required for colicin V production